MKRFFILYSLLCCTIAIAQSSKVELSIVPNSIEIGESFVITITSNVQGDVDIENLPSSFVQDYSIQQGHYPEMNHNTGKVNTVYFVSYSGVITKSGEYSIGPAFVKNGNKVYKSNSVKVKVGKQVTLSSGQISANQMSDPAFGVIEVNKKEIFEGEAVVLAAKIYSHYNPSNIGNYQSYPINSAVTKHSIGNNSDIKVSQEVVKGKKLYAFSYDKNVIFPDGIGKFQIDPFKLKLYQGYKNFPITSSSLSLTIKPLPTNPPKDFIGAVGNFKISRAIDTLKLKQGDVFKMTVVVSGIGNIQNISKPILSLPSGFVVYGDPLVTENYVIGIHGGEGEISFEYNIQVHKHGNLTLPETSISYFDPIKEKYIQIHTAPNQLKVIENKSFVVKANDDKIMNDISVEARNLSLRSNSSIKDDEFFFGQPLFWGGLTFPIIASLFFLFFVKRKEKNADQQIIKQVKRNKRVELQQLMDSISTIDEKEEMDRFYFITESIIRKAFEVKMNVSDEFPLTKLEILTYCKDNEMTEINANVEKLFSICEQSRYGFGGEEHQAQEVIRMLKEITNLLK